MKTIEEQIEEAKNEYYLEAYNQAEMMEFRHGDYYKADEFKEEKFKEFYKMIVNNLLKMIDTPICITKDGVFRQNQEIELINPEFNFLKNNLYRIKGIVSIENEEWVVKFEDKTYKIEDIRFY